MPFFRSRSCDGDRILRGHHGSRKIFRRRRNNDSETWAEFHKKYQSDVYRRSANSYSVKKYDTTQNVSRKISVESNQNFISKILEPPSAANGISPKRGSKRRAGRRASVA
eukprot:scaffold23831_cov127-Cylindrotheca_fusiformis.AAC.3